MLCRRAGPVNRTHAQTHRHNMTQGAQLPRGASLNKCRAVLLRSTKTSEASCFGPAPPNPHPPGTLHCRKGLMRHARAGTWAHAEGACMRAHHRCACWRACKQHVGMQAACGRGMHAACCKLEGTHATCGHACMRHAGRQLRQWHSAREVGRVKPSTQSVRD